MRGWAHQSVCYVKGAPSYHHEASARMADRGSDRGQKFAERAVCHHARSCRDLMRRQTTLPPRDMVDMRDLSELPGPVCAVQPFGVVALRFPPRLAAPP